MARSLSRRLRSGAMCLRRTGRRFGPFHSLAMVKGRDWKLSSLGIALMMNHTNLNEATGDVVHHPNLRKTRHWSATRRPSSRFFRQTGRLPPRRRPAPVTTTRGKSTAGVECVVLLDEAMEPISVAVGLDLTDRATQGELRAGQLPWAKGWYFRSSAVVGPWSPWTGTWDILVKPECGLHLSLSVNGEERQSTPLSEMSVTTPRQQVEALTPWAPVQSGEPSVHRYTSGRGPVASG